MVEGSDWENKLVNLLGSCLTDSLRYWTAPVHPEVWANTFEGCTAELFDSIWAHGCKSEEFR